ncbi:hydroxyethylthiazole kinase [Acinetobacter larvae]|uniref:hydroxyethylthiazole kinase n=1 Tax=Acinetobacter larvae TaxID=1789224 RepID=UPI0038996341
MLTQDQICQQIIQAHHDLIVQQPLVHCITNHVASNYVANVLLAAGASPAMIDNPHEAAAFASVSAALSINLGTPTEQQMQAIPLAIQAAKQQQRPWVLDPVGYGAVLHWRSHMVDQLLDLHPQVIRGNASELSALAGQQIESKGVDASVASEQVYQHCLGLLAYSDCVAISGAADYILWGAQHCLVRVDGGSALQPRITATGCALGALIAAYCAVAEVGIATIAAHAHFAIAAQLAAQQHQHLGHFAVAFMDHIQSLDAQQLQSHLKLHLSPLKD